MEHPPSSRRTPFSGLFGSSADPDLNIPVTGSGGGITSPYLNYDPAYISPDDQFIFPEGAENQRGRFEKAFSQIGGAVMAGAAIGGVNGFISGVKETKELTGAVRRTQMLNFVGKQGASSAQTFGVVLLMYSMFGVIFSKARGVDDDINTVASGTLTGVLYKSTAGLKGIRKGGLIGLGLSCIFVALKNKDRISSAMAR